MGTSTTNKYEGYLATVTGWGRIYSYGPFSDYLREVDVRVLSNSDCVNNYDWYSDEITNQMICAANSGKDSCPGDSGGPMVITAGDGVSPGQNYELIGVVSFGLGKKCALPLYPGVYARVTSVLNDWIKKIITDGEFCPRGKPDIWEANIGQG